MNTQSHFVKTPKGVQEMTSRKFGLGQRERRVLILLDGKRTADELSQTMPNVDVPAVVTLLVTEGYIAPLEMTTAEKPISRLAPNNENERFELAQRFMTNTVAHYLGFVGSGLANKISYAHDLDSLRALYEEWREALRLSADSRVRVGELEHTLAALLS